MRSIAGEINQIVHDVDAGRAEAEAEKRQQAVEQLVRAELLGRQHRHGDQAFLQPLVDTDRPKIAARLAGHAVGDIAAADINEATFAEDPAQGPGSRAGAEIDRAVRAEYAVEQAEMAGDGLDQTTISRRREVDATAARALLAEQREHILVPWQMRKRRGRFAGHAGLERSHAPPPRRKRPYPAHWLRCQP